MRKPFFNETTGKWVVRIPAGDGRLKQVTLGKSKRKAYEDWRAMLAREERQADNGGDESVLRLIGLFIEDMKEDVKLGKIRPKTITNRLVRLGPLSKFILAKHPDVTVSKLKPHHVSAFLKTRDKWGATTRHDCVQDLKRVFNWAIDEGRILTNPIASMKTTKGAPRDHVVSRKEYETLVNESGGSKFAGRHCRSFRPVLIASWLTGCRPSEIRRVKIQDVTNGRWVIAKHKNQKKSKRPRVVYLSPCMKTLTRILSHGRKSGPLFQPRDGGRWTYRETLQRMKRLKKKSSEIDKKCVLYSFRHTWITRAMLAGLDTGTVAAMAGTSIRMIDEHYGHLSRHEDHLEAAAARVAKGVSLD